MRDSYLRADGRLLTAVGVEGLLVVATEDAVLVAAKDRAQDVKALVERLKESGSQYHVSHLKVFRPWGSYQSLDAGDRFQGQAPDRQSRAPSYPCRSTISGPSTGSWCAARRG